MFMDSTQELDDLILSPVMQDTTREYRSPSGNESTKKSPATILIRLATGEAPTISRARGTASGRSKTTALRFGWRSHAAVARCPVAPPRSTKQRYWLRSKAATTCGELISP